MATLLFLEVTRPYHSNIRLLFLDEIALQTMSSRSCRLVCAGACSLGVRVSHLANLLSG